jgi:Domain of unknown function (DUF4388)
MSGQAAKRPAPDAGIRQGEIRSNTVPHLFHDLWVSRANGVLVVSEREIRKTVQFQAGRVQFASSNDRDDRFNQVLLKAGVIPLKDLLKALEVALATKDRLGEVLVLWKMMTAAEVEKWVKVQVQEIVYTLFNWTRGHFSFEPKPPAPEAITLGVSAEVMVIEGVRRIHSWARAYEEVGGLNTEYRTTKEGPAITADLPLLPGETALLALCEEPRSLGEICEASEMSDYEVCKSVWALLIVGALMKS